MSDNLQVNPTTKNNDPSANFYASVVNATQRGVPINFQEALTAALKNAHPGIDQQKIPKIAARLAQVINTPDLLPEDPKVRSTLEALRERAPHFTYTQNSLAKFYGEFSNIVDLNKPRDLNKPENV